MGRIKRKKVLREGTTKVAATLIQAAAPAGSSTQYPSTHPPVACSNHVCQEEGLFPEVARNIPHFARYIIFYDSCDDCQCNVLRTRPRGSKVTSCDLQGLGKD